MKFRQRQILFTMGLLCCAVVFLLHSRTPSGSDPVVERNRKAAQAFFDRRLAVDTNTANGSHPHQPIADNQNGKNGPGAANRSSQAILFPEKPLSYPSLSYVPRSSAGGKCPKLLRPINVSDNQTFQQVDGQTLLFVFSAFLDRQEKLVRIVGLKVLHSQLTVMCHLWYEVGGDKELSVVTGSVSHLPEHHGRKYTATYVQCPLPSEDSLDEPYAVSVTSWDCQQSGDFRQPSNVLRVLKPLTVERNFTVCVTALNFKYSRAYELVEMIEMNRLLGADMFTFYVNSVGDNVAKVLRWYQEKGLAQLIGWDLPVQVDHWPPQTHRPPEVHYFAQLASHNDCLNRHRGASRYLVYQDLDEFIIPKKTRTWAQMLQTFNQGSFAYLFRCVFFRKDWPPNEEKYVGRDVADRFKSVILSTTRREPNTFPHSQRAKYMVDPMGIQTVGIHNIWKYRGPNKLTNVWDKDALMHHYRSWENPNDVNRAVVDKDMFRFKDDLLGKLQERWRQLPEVPLDIPLDHYGPV